MTLTARACHFRTRYMKLSEAAETDDETQWAIRGNEEKVCRGLRPPLSSLTKRLQDERRKKSR